jgi:hypothetical protein
VYTHTCMHVLMDVCVHVLAWLLLGCVHVHSMNMCTCMPMHVGVCVLHTCVHVCAQTHSP